MDAETMKAIVASYWRYTKQCPFVALEASCLLDSFDAGGRADVLAMTERRLIIETEIKLNIGDLHRDKHKVKHRCLATNYERLPTHYFYFAVPWDIANTACLLCGNLYPYAGVLGVHGGRIEVYRKARLRKVPKASLRRMRNIAREQSATVCRLAQQVVELKQSLSGLAIGWRRAS
ncbi:unnamed protein product [marine sediment metagenome]|uniref:Uncharacterized protein n=1 Tax=marine sediment metagenome TaxID=412755 RepID=X1UAV2_9ZZZZ